MKAMKASEQYIKKSAVLAEIRKYKNNAEAYLKYHHNRNDKSVYAFEQEKLAMCELLSSLNNLEVKEVDLDFQTFAKEMDSIFALPSSETKNTEEEPLNWEYAIAKHFFELGLKASNPITATDRGTAEEIIINLKRVEKDYRIDLTREIEWLRNKVKKGEQKYGSIR